MKKLLLSIIAVVVTVAALGTSTFAWFTLSNRASVGEFNAQVSAGQGIEVSIDGTNWYTDIPAEIMQTDIESKSVSFKDLTSADGIAIVDKYGNTSAASAGSYYEVTLQFRSAKAGTKVYWTGATLNGSTTSADLNFTTDITFNYGPTTVTSGTVIVADPSNAARISIVTGSTAFVYEKPGVALTVAYVPGTNYYMGGKATTTAGLPTNNGAINYFNVKNSSNPIVAADYEAAVLKDTFNTFNNNNEDNQILTLTNANTAYPVTVKVWIEGWDADAFNSILGKTLFASLSFGDETVA